MPQSNEDQSKAPQASAPDPPKLTLKQFREQQAGGFLFCLWCKHPTHGEEFCPNCNRRCCANCGD